MNACHFIGRLVDKPEIRQTNGGTSVANFSIAVEASRRKVGDKWESKTVFLDIVAWGDAAERITEGYEKGQLIGLDTKLDEDQWTDKDGARRKKLRFVVTGYSRVPGVRYEKKEASEQLPANDEPAAVGASAADESDIPF